MSETTVSLQELSDNAWDIGTVAGVLQGIELTPTLLPNQKEAIADARKAIKRIEDRNKILVAKAKPSLGYTLYDVPVRDHLVNPQETL